MGCLGAVLRYLVCVAFSTSAIAAPANRKGQSRGFLRQIDNSTWVFGNNLWNLTQGRQYATKLYYRDRDLVGEAVGHYVSYSEHIWPSQLGLANIVRWCRIRSQLDSCGHC